MSELLPPPPPPKAQDAQAPTSPPDRPAGPPSAAPARGPSVPAAPQTGSAAPRGVSRGATVRLRIGRALGIAALAAPLVTQRIVDGGALWITVPGVLLAAAVLVVPARPTPRVIALGVLVVLVFGLIPATEDQWYAGIVIAAASTAVWLLARERHAIVLAVVLPVAAILEVGQTYAWVTFANSVYTRVTPSGMATLLTVWTLFFVLVEIALFVFAARLDRRVAPAAAARAERRAAARAGAPAAATVPASAALPRIGPVPVVGRTNTLAVLALVFGLLGSGVVPIVLGHVALAQVRRTGESGRGMAIAGLVLGYVALGIGLALVIGYAVTIAAITGGM